MLRRAEREEEGEWVEERLRGGDREALPMPGVGVAVTLEQRETRPEAELLTVGLALPVPEGNPEDDGSSDSDIDPLLLAVPDAERDAAGDALPEREELGLREEEAHFEAVGGVEGERLVLRVRVTLPVRLLHAVTERDWVGLAEREGLDEAWLHTVAVREAEARVDTVKEADQV